MPKLEENSSIFLITGLMNGGEKANNMTSKVLYNFHNCHDYLYSNYVETIKISMFFRETATSLTLLPELRE